MKNLIIIITALLFVSCSRKETQDISSISWVGQYNLQEDEIHKIITTGKIPAPKIPVTVEGITKNCMIDLGTYDLVLNEKYFDLQNFEPYRLCNKQISSREMLLEEGVLDNINILESNENAIPMFLMKKSNSVSDFKGLIGWQFFQSQLFILDLQNNLVGITACHQNSPQGIPFYTGKNPSKENSMLKFQGILNNIPITVSLCTSIRHSQVSPEILSKLDEKTNSEYTTLDSLKIGDIIFRDFTVHLNKDQSLLEPNNNKPIDLILGLNEIKKYLLILNFCNSKIYFEYFQ